MKTVIYGDQSHQLSKYHRILPIKARFTDEVFFLDGGVKSPLPYFSRSKRTTEITRQQYVSHVNCEPVVIAGNLMII